jgi:hypothetical protein
MSRTTSPPRAFPSYCFSLPAGLFLAGLPSTNSGKTLSVHNDKHHTHFWEPFNTSVSACFAFLLGLRQLW